MLRDAAVKEGRDGGGGETECKEEESKEEGEQLKA